MAKTNEEEMPRWHASMCLSLLAANEDSSNNASIEIEGEEESRGAKDVFEDGLVLNYLREKKLALDMILKKKDMILQQTQQFEWEGAHLLRKLLDEGKCVVTRPQDHEKLMLHIHEELRYFGVKRTYNLYRVNIGGLVCKQMFNRLSNV